MTIAWEAVGATDVGRIRSGNEDTFHVDGDRGLFLVADGMGGHAAGEIASALAAAAVAEALARAVDAGADGETMLALLRAAFHAAHGEIARYCQEAPQAHGMGTTLTALVLDRRGAALVGHIGDSRLYRLRDDHLEQITHDHTWVQREIDEGRLTPAAAQRHPFSHILTRVLSEELDPEIDVQAGFALPGDLLLLCTDGLYNMLDDLRLKRLLLRPAPLAETAGALIAAANRRGGADNITVVLVRVVEG